LLQVEVVRRAVAEVFQILAVQIID